MSLPHPDAPWDATTYLSLVLLVISIPAMFFCVCGLPLNVVGLVLWHAAAPKTKINHQLYIAHWIALSCLLVLYGTAVVLQIFVLNPR